MITMSTYQAAHVQVKSAHGIPQYSHNIEKITYCNETTPFFKDLEKVKNLDWYQWKMGTDKGTITIPIGTREEILSNRQFMLSNEVQFAYKVKSEILNRQSSCRIEDTLYYIFESIETSLIEAKYNFCNELLLICRNDMDKYSDEVLIGILTASLPWKKRLPFRTTFLNDVKIIIHSKYDATEANAILLGLD